MTKVTCPKGHKAHCATCRSIERYKTDPAFKKKQDEKTMKWYWRKKAERKLETAMFRCPKCKKVDERSVPVGRQSVKSFCEVSGTDVRMVRVSE
jgi:hypothetical protein